jgi:hypothetical protein
MKIADSVWYVYEGLWIRASSFTPPSTGLSGTQFSTLNSAGSNDPEWQEKYNNTEVKNGATQNLTPAVVKYKNLEVFIQSKYTIWLFLELKETN